MVAVLLVDVGLAIYILPKDPAMDLFIYSDGVQVDFTIGEQKKEPALFFQEEKQALFS